MRGLGESLARLVCSRAALTLAVLLGGGGAAAEPPPCRAQAEFERGDAVIGQQIVYRIRIERRDDVDALDWSEPPAFPGFRAEWLPDVAEPAGPGTRRFSERRALFPERAGELATTPARLRCRVGAVESTVELPAVSLRVDPQPAAARPDHPTGLVGPLAIERVVTPARVRLGESLRVALMLRGEGELWLADDPLGPVASAEVFRRRPTTSVDAARRLVVKRHFAYDVVPLATGRLEIPEVRVSYYDAATGRYTSAGADAMTIEVAPAASTAVADATKRSDTPPPRRPSPPPTRAHDTTKWRTVAGALLVALLGATVAVAVSRRREARARNAAVDAALPASDDDAAATARALRLALAARVAGAASRTPEELAADPALPACAAAAVERLAEAERARFDPGAAPPSAAAVRAALALLR